MKEEDRLNLSLDDIIEQQNKKSGRSNNLKTRGSAGRRNQRLSKPYENKNIPVSTMKEGDVEVKFLVSHYAAGLLIGKGGGKIRKLSGITRTVIIISSQDEVYPGTSYRYITIRGSLESVTLVISIFWEVVALEVREDNLGSRNIWMPTGQMSHHFDNVRVEAKLAIPAACVGKIIGPDMVVVRAMVDNTGATVRFAKRFEPSLPGCSDRIITIAGEVIGCVELTGLILEKVKDYYDNKQATQQNDPAVNIDLEDEYQPQTNRRHSRPPRRQPAPRQETYLESDDDDDDDDDDESAAEDPGYVGFSASTNHGGFKTGRQVMKVSNNMNVSSSPANVTNTNGNKTRRNTPSSTSAEVVSASTTVSLSVPDSLVGNIMGPKVYHYVNTVDSDVNYDIKHLKLIILDGS
jgi:hypothetical protein